MQYLPDFDIINTTGVYISFFLSFCTILYWLYRFFAAVLNYSKIKNVKSGIYNGFWVDPIKKEINCEVLRLKKTIKGVVIQPIYKHKAFHDYKVSIRPYQLNQYIFGGSWIGQKNTIYRGYSLFLYSIEDETFTGKWIGPKSSGDVNSGEWVMVFFTEAKNSYLLYRKFSRLYTIREKLFAKTSIIDGIISKHLSYSQNFCEIDGVKLHLHRDSFNPLIGKISIPFANYIKTVVQSTDTVLDLGTGTGFYPIYLAQKKGCKVKGIDIDEKTITLARRNAVENNIRDLTEFTTCSKTELFSSIRGGEKFDYIIANLPFTRISKSYRSKGSELYSSFSGTVNLLEQLILGSQYHVKPNGKLIFCYGESGYIDLLESIVKISSWKHLNIIKSINERDDTFYIIELELSEKIKKYYQTLSSEQELLEYSI